ncbi:MAG TPA: PfkB family carbohydrate kinase, partial [Pseudonocardia sp.]
VSDDGLDRVAAPRVSHGDPCGAGDAFAGSFAAALAEGKPHPDAVRHAVRRAARFVAEGGAGGFAARRAATLADGTGAGTTVPAQAAG